MELVNVSFLQPVLDGCEKAGVNYQKLIQQSPLKYFDCSHPDNRLPMNAAHDFVSHIASHQGMDNIAKEFAANIKLSALSDFGEIIATAPSLFDALSTAEKMSTAILSNEIMRLKIHGNKAIFYQNFSNLSPIEYDRFMQINFIYMLDAFDYLTHDGWQPDKIHCQKDFDPKVMDLFPQFRNTKLVLDQPHTAIIFDAADLTHSNYPSAEKAVPLDLVNAGSLNHKIGLLIDSFNNQFGSPNIETMSSLLNMSERTLRRRLTEEGTTFNEIMSSWRVRKSIELLEQTTYSVNDIAQRLHYTNANNFTRAFKKVFSVSPQVYRENLNTKGLVH